MFEPKSKMSNKSMKSKTVFGFLLAVLTVALLGSFASAATLNLENFFTQVDDVPAAIDGNNAVVAGSNVPIDFEFISNENASGVEVSIWIQGFRSETRVDKSFPDLVDGSRYKGSLNVKIPTDIDKDSNNDDPNTDKLLTLVVRIESDQGSYEQEYTLRAQREAHNLDVLLVEFDNQVKPGSTLPVDVVIKNRGRHQEEDTFVTLSIPQLGISKTGYFEDLFPVDLCDSSGDCDQNDVRERRLFLTIPSNAKPGLYQVEVMVKSDESDMKVMKTLNIVSSPVEGKVLTNPVSKTFSVGEEAVYELILVNTGNKIAIYNLIPQASDSLSVSLSDSVATVPAGSSKTVKVYVKANREGTFNFAVSANSDEFSEIATYTATVQGKSIASAATNSNIVVITIVLAIIFVVLLVILIVLLTRKPERSEEFGESYY